MCAIYDNREALVRRSASCFANKYLFLLNKNACVVTLPVWTFGLVLSRRNWVRP